MDRDIEDILILILGLLLFATPYGITPWVIYRILEFTGITEQWVISATLLFTFIIETISLFGLIFYLADREERLRREEEYKTIIKAMKGEVKGERGVKTGICCPRCFSQLELISNPHRDASSIHLYCPKCKSKYKLMPVSKDTH